MTKDEYLKNKSNIEDVLSKVKKDLRDLKLEYIEANKTMNIGEKVRVTKYKRTPCFAFVSSIDVGWHDELVYDFAKCKIDGTQSQHSLYAHKTRDLIEKII